MGFIVCKKNQKAKYIPLLLETASAKPHQHCAKPCRDEMKRDTVAS